MKYIGKHLGTSTPSYQYVIKRLDISLLHLVLNFEIEHLSIASEPILQYVHDVRSSHLPPFSSVATLCHYVTLMNHPYTRKSISHSVSTIHTFPYPIFYDAFG